MKTYIFKNTIMPLVNIYIGATSQEQAEVILKVLVSEPKNYKFEMEIK